MDPVTLILTALAAGAATGGQAIATDAVKDVYAGLKVLIQKSFIGKPNAEVALTGHESDPKTWEAPLRKALVQEGVAQDPEVIAAALNVMKLVQPQQAAMGKYNVQIAGNVYGYTQGDNQTVNMYFGDEPKEQ